MADGESLPHNGGEELPPSPNEINGLSIPIPEYPDGLILRALDKASNSNPQNQEHFRPPRTDIELREVFAAVEISEQGEWSAAVHRDFQDIFRAGYLKLLDESKKPGLRPEVAAMMREEASRIRTRMYHHILKAYPMERKRFTELEWDWPDTSGEEAA